jgi:hypothetical protein
MLRQTRERLLLLTWHLHALLGSLLPLHTWTRLRLAHQPLRRPRHASAGRHALRHPLRLRWLRLWLLLGLSLHHHAQHPLLHHRQLGLLLRRRQCLVLG